MSEQQQQDDQPVGWQRSMYRKLSFMETKLDRVLVLLELLCSSANIQLDRIDIDAMVLQREHARKRKQPRRQRRS